MTGPEHYAEAERLLIAALDYDSTPPNGTPPGVAFKAIQRGDTIAAAQVHATLALAAATAYPAIVAYTGDETSHESYGWANATAPRGSRVPS